MTGKLAKMILATGAAVALISSAVTHVESRGLQLGVRNIGFVHSRRGRTHRECAHCFLTRKTHAGGRLARQARDPESPIWAVFVWSLHGTRVAVNTIR
jgi:hypothetical protein